MAARLPHNHYSPAVLALAAANGIDIDELPGIIDGCSGGLSWIYVLAGRRISCEHCCDLHDLRYQLGGAPAQRREADRELRDCAAVGGWRTVRAWVMYGAVRVGGRWYWAGEGRGNTAEHFH